MKKWVDLAQENTLKLFYEKMETFGGRIFLYGAGVMLYDALPCLEQCGFVIEGIIDGDPQKQGTDFQGIPIMSLKAAAPKLKDCGAAITTEKYADEIMQQLKDCLPEQNIFRTSMYPLGAVRGKSILHLREYLENHLDELSEVRGLWADEHSRTAMDTVLDSWLRFQGNRLAQCVTAPQYFVPEIVAHVGGKPILVDVGAYTGDTVAEAMNVFPHVQMIYAFEADRNNFNELYRQYSTDPRVKAYQLAISNRSGTTAFSVGYNSCSRTTGHCLKGSSETEPVQIVRTEPLDDALEDMDQRISMIKIDVEGNELDVLRGAEQRIMNDQPALAVCLYHRNEDIIDIPLWLHRRLPNYRFFFRQHSIHGTDAVLYAVC